MRAPAHRHLAAEPVGAPRRGRSRRRRWVFAGLGVVLLGLLMVIGCALFTAAAGREALTLRDALTARDAATAQSRLNSASRDLTIARVLALPLRALAVVPFVGTPARDLVHLLDGSAAGLDAAGQGLVILTAVQQHDLVHNGGLDVDVIGGLAAPAAALRVDADRSRAELTAVQGGIVPGVATARDRLLAIIGPIAADADLLAPAVARLPAALGAAGARQYVVATLNSAELFPAGGAPLGVALVEVDRGRPMITSRGQVSQLTHLNELVPWTPLPTDPWQRDSKAQRLANADYSPDFPTSGEEILRLYKAQFGQDAGGAIALDAPGLRMLLQITGPLQVAGYGKVEADNVVQVTLVDAYRQYGSSPAGLAKRHAANNALIDAAFKTLVTRPRTLADLEKIVQALREGHVQVYVRDAPLQGALDSGGLANSLPPAPNDALGVYTINANASKVDVAQFRTITQDVALAADGSADVTRTVTIRYDLPGPCPSPDPGTGYTTCTARPRVVLYVPSAATGAQLRQNGVAVSAPTTLTERGRTVFSFLSGVPRGSKLTVVLRYHLPAPSSSSSSGSGSGPAYSLVASGQPMVHPAALTVRVTAPAGRTLSFAADQGWRRDGNAAVLTLAQLSGTRTFSLS